MLNEAITRWFTTPSGNLVWDVLLEVLGIFFTVVVLQQLIEGRERKRWRPVRQDLYMRLLSYSSWIVGLLPRAYLEGRPHAWYRFGNKGYGGYYLDDSFARELWALEVTVLYERVAELADSPEDVPEAFRFRLKNASEDSAAVFLATDPELNILIASLRERISDFEGSLETYREARESGADDIPIGGSSPINQAGITLKELIITGFLLRRWLADRADSYSSSP